MSYIIKEDDPNIQKLIHKINNLVESMTILFEKGRDEPGLILFYCLIDQLSWLSSEKEFTDGRDFKLWVTEYFDTNLLNCNEEDLWNHRCTLCHMGTSKSKQYKEEKHRQIGFYKNIVCSESQLNEIQSKYASPINLVDLGNLIAGVNNAVEKFLFRIAYGHEFRDRVLKKVEKMTDVFSIN